jgi:hypothetical protein
MRLDNDDVLRRAWGVRHDFRRRGLFTTTEYRAALGRALRGVPAEELDRVASVIDRESLRETPPGRLYAGEFDLEGEYMLRGDRRVAKAKSLWEHAQEHLAVLGELVAGLKDQN